MDDTARALVHGALDPDEYNECMMAEFDLANDFRECLPELLTRTTSQANGPQKPLRHLYRAHGVAQTLPSPPLYAYLLEGRYTPEDIVRGLSGLHDADAERIRNVVVAAKGTGVVVGLASCVVRAGYRSSHELLNLRLLSSRGPDPFPRPLSFQRKGFTDLKEACIVSKPISRKPCDSRLPCEVVNGSKAHVYHNACIVLYHRRDEEEVSHTLCDGVAWALQELMRSPSESDNANVLGLQPGSCLRLVESGNKDFNPGTGDIALPVQDPLRILLWYALAVRDTKLWKQALDLDRILQAKFIIKFLEYAIKHARSDIWVDVFGAFTRSIFKALTLEDSPESSTLASLWYPDCTILESSLKGLGFEVLKESLDAYLELWANCFEAQLEVFDLLARPSVSSVNQVLIRSWTQVHCDRNLPYYHRGRYWNNPEMIVKMASKCTKGLKALEELVNKEGDFGFAVKLATKLLENPPTAQLSDSLGTATSVLHLAVSLWEDGHGVCGLTGHIEHAVSISQLCLEAARLTSPAASTTSADITPLSAVARLNPMEPCQKVLASILANQLELGTTNTKVVYSLYDRLKDICVPFIGHLREWHHRQPWAKGDLMQASPFKEFVAEMVGVYMELCVGKRVGPYVHPLVKPVGCQSGFVAPRERPVTTLTAASQEEYKPRGVCRHCARLDEFLLSPSRSSGPSLVQLQAGRSRQSPEMLLRLAIIEEAPIVDHLKGRLSYAGRYVSWDIKTDHETKSKQRLEITTKEDLWAMKQWDGPDGRVESAWVFLKTLFAIVGKVSEREDQAEDDMSEQEDQGGRPENAVSAWEDLAKSVLGEEEWGRIHAILDDKSPLPAPPTSQSTLEKGNNGKRKKKAQPAAGPSTRVEVGTKRKRGPL
ncbi:hypothetical protein BKA70DRAFT_1346635 [Coprinopsis sp. MPI-PUGE-AT-0042]|nr:hypothetical protein BKA70DRAFT_1346635 [Coprinopsis sp. MPI-PUGE-AT-0042]